jgi:hypothetical protein
MAASRKRPRGTRTGSLSPCPGRSTVIAPHPLETFQQRKERKRRGAAAVQEHDRWALARLDDMDPSPRAELHVSTSCPGGPEDPLVDLDHLVGVGANWMTGLISRRPNAHAASSLDAFLIIRGSAGGA